MKVKEFFIGAALIVVLWSVAWAQRRVTPMQQTSFGSETSIRHPVKIPPTVLRQLAEMNREQLNSCMETDGSEEADLPKYFTASSLDINGDGKSDLLVQAGEKQCFHGAHNTSFWLFINTGEGYDNIFQTQTDWLDVMKSETNGHHDLRTAGHSAIEIWSTLWKYDGKQYAAAECTRESMTRKTVRRVRCSP
jgi:hypothetical protein